MLKAWQLPPTPGRRKKAYVSFEWKQILHQAPHRALAFLQRLRRRPQAFVEETVRLLEAQTNTASVGLECGWKFQRPSPILKAHALAVAFDALLLQQQHALALTIQLQLTRAAEDIVLYWNLLNVVLSSEEVSRVQASEDITVLRHSSMKTDHWSCPYSALVRFRPVFRSAVGKFPMPKIIMRKSRRVRRLNRTWRWHFCCARASCK